MAMFTNLSLGGAAENEVSVSSELDRIRKFQSKVSILFETPEYLVKTAENGRELIQVLQFRHEVFVKEWQGRENESGLDIEPTDFVADHVMILEKQSDQVVGTYRLLNSNFVMNFYSESEFEIDEFLRLPDSKVELGRAAIHADYRNGNTIDLLWKGLSRYIFKSKCRYLFGCSSLKTEDANLVNSLHKFYADKSVWTQKFNIKSTDKYDFPEFDREAELCKEVSEVKASVPPLLRSYIHAGAKIYGEPAHDKEFQCLDLFTVLDMHNLNTKFHRRYFGFDN